MTRGRKLTDKDVQAIRERRADGESAAALAREFGVSRQHITRLAKGEQRPALDALAERVGEPGRVLEGLLGLLDGLEPDPGERVIAETAKVVAAKIDAVSQSEAIAAAAALPQLGRQLLDLLEALPHGRDRMEEIMEPLRQARSRKGANGRR